MARSEARGEWMGVMVNGWVGDEWMGSRAVHGWEQGQEWMDGSEGTA